MEEAQKYRDQFLEAAGEIEINLTLMLEDWDNSLNSDVEIDELYRMIHSLKSGAAFLDLRDLESGAHAVEDGIELFRRERGEELKPLLEEFLNKLDLSHWEKPEEEEEFTEGEKSLLKDAENRGETLYRISCHIDPAEPMKKARAFLIQNNLEISFNVIKTQPSLNSDADFTRFTLYLTTSERRDALRRAMDVDRIQQIRIDRYSLNDKDSEEEAEVIRLEKTTRRHPVSVEKDRLEELDSYLSELKKLSLAEDGKAGPIISGMDRVLDNILYEPAASLFSAVDLYLRKLCDRYSKKIELRTAGDFRIPMGQVQSLTEIFQQLVRNSLIHGLGRDGVITLKAEKREGEGRIIYADNGKGLDEDSIRNRTGDRESDLLSLVCRPGFTTSETADILSGRGMGLNLVRHNTELLGGRLSMKNGPQGLAFMITLPEEESLSLLQFRSGRNIAAVPLPFVEEELELNRRSLKKNREGRFFYLHRAEYLPLFEGTETVKSLTAMKRAKFVIITSYLTGKYALLADELLLESTVPRKVLRNMLYIDPAHLEEEL